MENEDENIVDSKVILLGLLNFVDGLWLVCGGERIIVFIINFVDKLDSVLVCKGRMDKYIELIYCCFEVFKVLVKNYLDVEESEFFEEIKRLFEDKEIKMILVDIVENLLFKFENEGLEICLKCLI